MICAPHILSQKTSGTYDYEAGSSHVKRSRNVETIKEALLLDVHHEFFKWRGCSTKAKSCYNSRLATLLPKLIYSPQIVDWQLLHKIGCGDEIDQMLKISLKEAQSDEEIFFFVAWVRAFNIREPIYPELCCEFYATYEFDEVCADDELQSKKIISFRLGGRAHSLTLLEFARRLGLYHAEELEEEGFDTYFQGGLRSDENFNAREYWERISIDRDLHLSRSSITPKLGIKCGLGVANGNEKKGSWKSEGQSDLLDLDRTTLRELIDSEDRLIHEILILAGTTRLQDTIRLDNCLMDQRVCAAATKDADNKRKWDDKKEGNHRQQQKKRQEVVRVYVARTGSKIGYAGTLPLCDSLYLHAQYLDDGTIVEDTLVMEREDPRSRIEGVFPPNISRPLHGVKLLGGPASVDFDFSSELVMKRVAKAIGLMDAVANIIDP
ncbi:hypothetical protein Tco_1456888 [Tanacetum coccineum]